MTRRSWSQGTDEGRHAVSEGTDERDTDIQIKANAYAYELR